MRDNPEERLQKAVVQYLMLSLPDDVLWYHCPNGEYRSKRTAARLKLMGVRPGVSDLPFVIQGRAAFIELKATKRSLSGDQEAFEALVERAGGLFAVCRSLEEVEDTLTAWGVNMKIRLRTQQPRPIAGRVR